MAEAPRYRWAPYAGVFGAGASTTHDNDQVLLIPIAVAGESEGPQVYAVMVGRRRAGAVDAPGVEQALPLAELVLAEWAELGAAKSPAASQPG